MPGLMYEPMLRLERLYQQLGRLEIAPAFETALGESLQLLAELTHCEVAYVEVDTFWVGRAPSDIPAAVLRARVSRDVVERTISGRAMVQARLTAAHHPWREPGHVLGTPISLLHTTGALYVESNAPFTSNEKERLLSVARALANAWMTSARRDRSLTEELQDIKERRIRAAMERHRDNIALVARSLGVSRTTIYRALGDAVAPADTPAGQLHRSDTD